MFNNYIKFVTFIILGIYISMFFIEYNYFQGYLLATIIFILSGINFFIIRKSEKKFPFIIIKLFSKRIKINNYRLLFLGALFVLIGMLLIYLIDKKMPSAYIEFCTGIFFISNVTFSIENVTNCNVEKG